MRWPDEVLGKRRLQDPRYRDAGGSAWAEWHFLRGRVRWGRSQRAGRTYAV